MSAAHTPGPWFLVETPHDNIISSWDVLAGEHEISVFPYKRFYSKDRSKSGLAVDPERMANARLIAAAPCLLAALLIAVRQNDHEMLMTGEELRICYSAIAKATGGAA